VFEKFQECLDVQWLQKLLTYLQNEKSRKVEVKGTRKHLTQQPENTSPAAMKQSCATFSQNFVFNSGKYSHPVKFRKLGYMSYTETHGDSAQTDCSLGITTTTLL
jgi:hypothetical protein